MVWGGMRQRLALGSWEDEEDLPGSGLWRSQRAWPKPIAGWPGFHKSRHGQPQALRRKEGTVFISTSILEKAKQQDVPTADTQVLTGHSENKPLRVS